jgi:hypothetical protein
MTEQSQAVRSSFVQIDHFLPLRGKSHTHGHAYVRTREAKHPEKRLGNPINRKGVPILQQAVVSNSKVNSRSFSNTRRSRKSAFADL